MHPPRETLTFDLLTLKVVSEPRVKLRCTTQRDVRQHHCLMPPPMGFWFPDLGLWRRTLTLALI